jgi:hypothetical protein
MKAMAGLVAICLGVAPAAAEIAVHRDPGCGCCEKWAEQVRANFKEQVRIIDDQQRGALQKRLGVPADLASCHTAIVGGYVFEGHVPIADMKKLIAEHPKGVSGLAVAGMPMGSPGMEVKGMKPQPYTVVAFGPSGRRTFARH